MTISDADQFRDMDFIKFRCSKNKEDGQGKMGYKCEQHKFSDIQKERRRSKLNGLQT